MAFKCDERWTYPKFSVVQRSLVLAVNTRRLGDVRSNGQQQRENRILKDHDIASLKPALDAFSLTTA